MKQLFLILLLFITANIDAAKDVTQGRSASSRTLRTRVGNCLLGQARAVLDVNNVRCELQTTGDIWWDRGTQNAKYGVPKLSQDQLQAGGRQVNALYDGAIWISGFKNGNLAITSIRFSSATDAQFWPGPIAKGTSTIDQAVCNKFDRFWTVTKEEIDAFKSNPGNMSASISKWPGRKNKNIRGPGLEFSEAEMPDESLAPFYDINANQVYEPELGEHPTIKYTTSKTCATYAHKMIFWVINDVGNNHIGPDATPIGVQVNCLAFAFSTSDELNNMTFYTYEIHNQSTNDLEESYMSQFVDCDMGNFSDDYVGCDTTRALGFCVNGDADDQTGNVPGYGLDVPIVGVDFFEGPKDASGNQIGMSSFSYFLNVSGSPVSDPSTDVEHRNVQEGRARNGQLFTSGGSGDCISGTTPTRYCFPGNPSDPTQWSMCSRGLPLRDIRFVQNSGPFKLDAGSQETITVGVIFVQPPRGSYDVCRINVEQWLAPADDKAQKLYDNCFALTPGPDAPEIKIVEESNKLILSIENPASSNNVGETFRKKDLSIPVNAADSMFKFEGYLIFQVKDPSKKAGTLEELRSDPNNAALIAAMDLKNNITFPKKFYMFNGVKVPYDSLPFNNSGISHEMVITEDRFASEGSRFLTNNKTYYFAVVAIAYNNYQVATSSQLEQYKVSDKVKIFAASPHDNSFYGMKRKAEFLQTLPVTRMSGVGHGNYFLEVTEKDERDIVLDNEKLEITYLGDRSPVRVIVHNPYKLIDAEFSLKIYDSASNPVIQYNKDSAYWNLELSGNPEVVSSEFNLNRSTRQSVYANIAGSLTSLGIGIATSDVNPIGKNPRNGGARYGMIGASISYQDSSRKWMTPLKDQDNTAYRDWIRSGTERNVANNNTEQFASNYILQGGNRIYTDSTKHYSTILEGTIAPYCLADNRYTTSAANQAANYFSAAPGFKWSNLGTDLSGAVINSHQCPENNLDSLFSVNIVITDNDSFWSRGVVLETNDERSYNEGGAIKGQIRKAVSFEKDLKTPIPGDTGRSWFPGYAINVETGERMNIYFGENSYRPGRPMVWDPSNVITTTLGDPLLGNGHFVYVTNTKYDEGEKDQTMLLANFNKKSGSGNSEILDPIFRPFYRSLIWTFIPLVDSANTMSDKNGNYMVPKNKITIKLRVERPYQQYSGSGFSEYRFSTRGLAPEKANKTLLDSSFRNMRIVPNPYNAYSIYEGSSTTQNIVKFIGVPKNSTVSIFTTDGTLVRRIKYSESGQDNYFAANQSIGEVNQDNAVLWDMRTTSGILIASGVYYVHVEAPGYGEKVMKLFATMRSVDVSNF